METIERNRRSGRSTRLVDYYIQQLFLFGEIKIEDHTKNKESNIFLFERIKRRLKSEHPHLCYSVFSKAELIIKLRKEY